MSLSAATKDSDYLTPSQQCIKPLQILNRKPKQPRGIVTISVEDDGGYYETEASGEKKRLEEVKISLNDCLACRYAEMTSPDLKIHQ
jgi:hypothetical protein